MAFRDAFNRRRRTPGFAGGTLEEQLEREALQTYSRPRRGTMEVRTGELEGLAPPSLPQDSMVMRRPPSTLNLVAHLRGNRTTQDPQPPEQPGPRKYYHDIGEIPIHTKPGGLDMYSDLAVKRGERPIDAVRRENMQRAMLGEGDPVMPGSATFATNTELAGPDRRLNLDYVPTSERTRPRRVNDVPPDEIVAPVPVSPFKQAFNRKPVETPEQEGFGSSGEPFGARPRRTQPRDYVADDAQYLRDLQTQPRNWKDKVVDVIDAVSTGFGNKPRTTMTKRERQIAEAEQRLGTGLTVGQKQNAIQAGQMIPVTLEDGTVVEVPARSAGNLQSQQQRIRQMADQAIERKRVNSARIERWERMEARDRKRLLADLYKSGGTNDPEQLEYIADQLGIPGALRPKFIQGQMRDAVDADGNLIQINRQTQDVLPTGEKSYEVTKEAGRNRRFAEGQVGATTRAGMRSAGASKRQELTAGERTDIAETSALINQVRRQLTDVDSKINAINAKGANASTEEKAQLAVLGRERAELVETGALQADKLNQIDPEREWGSGTGGYPYSKPKPQQVSSDLNRPIYGKPVGGKAKLNEATVRQAAIDAGLDPDEAVRRARLKGRL